jgi:hypothetical protein
MKPKYTTYEDLLDFAEEEYDSFSLVWRNHLSFTKSAWQVEEDLRPYLISEFSSHKWPGTEIIGGKALVRTYRVSPESLSVLRQVSSVFDWLAPDYPEDLAFYKGNKLAFASVAHEGEAWFET